MVKGLDVFRLFPLLPGDLSINCPQDIRKDLVRFMDRLVTESGINLKSLGIRTQSLDDIIHRLKELYGI